MRFINKYKFRILLHSNIEKINLHSQSAILYDNLGVFRLN